MIRTCVLPGTIIMSDECPAYNGLVAHGYDHHVVPHAFAFCGADGTNDNQCESYNSRLRRAEYGVFHNVTSKYLQSMADEFAWREDSRRLTNLEIFGGLVNRVFSSGLSKLRGYYQRRHSRDEETRWRTFKSEVNGVFGMMCTVSGR